MRPHQDARDHAPTPPMGWMSWNAFGRDLSAKVVLETARAMVSSGLRDAGYEYVCLDDHWQGGRAADGSLVADPVRFPAGIAALADEIQSMGLRLGIYTCAGRLTCGGEVGSEGFEEQDAATFAGWGVDFVKDDYCHAPPERVQAIERYRRMGEALVRSGRSMVFALCEWGQRAPWEWGASVHASMWRTTGDIRDAWSGPGGILANAEATERVSAWGGPGAWNDPDMLVAGLRGRSRWEAAGTRGCTEAEYRTQVSLWAMLAAPLFASCDLREADASTLAILGRPPVLAIDQDPLGSPGRRVARNGPLEVWQRPLSGGATAVAILNRSRRSRSVRVDWPSVRGGVQDVVDAWTDLPAAESRRPLVLERHATALFRVGQASAPDQPLVAISPG